MTLPSASRMAAAESSIGCSVPSLEIKTVWFASPNDDAGLAAPQASGYRLVGGVSSLTIWNTSGRGRLAASSVLHPTSSSATGLRKSTRPSASVLMTASPMLASVTCSRSRCSWISRAFSSAAATGNGFFRQASGVFLRVLPVGHIPGNLRETPVVAGLIAQRCNDDVRPKPRAVFTDAPALVLEPSFGAGDLQFVLGPAAFNGVGRIEAGKVLADDFRALVPP